ncbi:trans-4-hydroxy-L-proline dehydratase [Clostridium luticellarii]|uniref:Benzylsuccinate synthase alpha subunit n=1 Tax=Clostridium luticellarii TaxID=1691940 RepID=A0A2T0BKU4_9CLOT|nr:trans-4-hydroxy-L-proline dehydratase [Clostridium luticellarii]MCI1969234.1 glycyl radical protein [Clostridium luticellarii]MCI1997018.1 glycyl radical protein [Clostridium luticellarii]PRR84453.1 Benzylsuccinate synthase alpha subunit [Clostridium luticellarii]
MTKSATAERTRRGSTERIRRLREISTKKCKPSISMERAVLLTEAYKMYEGKFSTPVLRGLAFKHIMKNRTLYIEKGAIIIGEKGHKPWAAPTFPELCCHTMEDFDNMNNREKVFFKVSEEDKRIQKEVIIPYWKNRALMTRMNKLLPDEWHKLFDAGLYTEFLMQRGPGHTVADGKIYRKGYADFIEDIQYEVDHLDYNKDVNALNKKEELEGMKLVCESMIIFGERYAAKARALAAAENDPQWKKELLELAEVCDVVPKHAPQTFRQAVQMYWFTHIGVTVEMNNWDAYSPGKLDQHLEPFYEKDIEEGRLTREGAREILENLWIQFNNQPAPPKVGITLKESATYTDFCNINTGALRPDGTTGVNEVSYLILEVMDEMKLLQPSSNVQISRKTPEKFLRDALKISRKGWGQPAFYNSEAIIQELLFLGKSIDDARESGIASGCVETGTAGKEAYVLTGYLNIPKIFELVLNRGFDSYTQKQVGLDLGDPRDFKSYEEVYDAFYKQLEYVVNVKIAGNNLIERMYMEHMPVPLLSVITDDCIKSGVDYNAGGARYNTSYIQCVGIATITDSLVAIKKNIFEDEKFSMNELLKACKADFKGYDEIFETVYNHTPKYGNDDDYADDILKDVSQSLQDAIAGRTTPKGSRTVVEFLPTTCHVYFGQVMEASPNGRHAGISLPDGISPEKGADRNGPTAVVKSASKIDQLKTGGALLNQKFTPAVVQGEEGISNLAALIRSYFAIDGHHIQFNVIDRKTLLDAQKHPEEYENLIVRVAGYSDYFNNLDRALQDEIINRTEQSFA